jgi:hypothetical protein
VDRHLRHGGALGVWVASGSPRLGRREVELVLQVDEHHHRVDLVAGGESIIKHKSPLNVLKYTHDYSSY